MEQQEETNRSIITDTDYYRIIKLYINKENAYSSNISYIEVQNLIKFVISINMNCILHDANSISELIVSHVTKDVITDGNQQIHIDTLILAMRGYSEPIEGQLLLYIACYM